MEALPPEQGAERGEAADVARLGRRGAGLGEGRRCLRLRCCAQAGLVEVHRLVEVLRATKARKRRANHRR